MKSIADLKGEGWDNCKQTGCGYFFRQSRQLPAGERSPGLDVCPACRHPVGAPVTYNQPTYEPPTLD